MSRSQTGKVSKYQVDILGEVLEVRSDSNEEDVLKIVKYVDEKMRLAVSEGKSTSREKAAVLAALNIAEEFFREKISELKTKEEVEERLGRLIDMIQKQIEM